MRPAPTLDHTSKYDGSIQEKYQNMMVKSVKCNSYAWPVLRVPHAFPLMARLNGGSELWHGLCL